MISAVIDNSIGKPVVSMEDECWEMTTKLRKWMFDNIYIDSPAKTEEGKARHIIKTLFEYYTEILQQHCDDEDKIQRLVTDYISGMTDRYAIERFSEIFIPKGIQTNKGDEFLYKLIKNLK